MWKKKCRFCFSLFCNQRENCKRAAKIPFYHLKSFLKMELKQTFLIYYGILGWIIEKFQELYECSFQDFPVENATHRFLFFVQLHSSLEPLLLLLLQMLIAGVAFDVEIFLRIYISQLKNLISIRHKLNAYQHLLHC